MRKGEACRLGDSSAVRNAADSSGYSHSGNQQGSHGHHHCDWDHVAILVAVP